MSINDSFYKNVFLLMQMVPASFECRQLFRKEMFTKPNTVGFIHISHYLLSVYDAKHFKNAVKWPIMNKTDEKQYRTEVKQYLEILKNENPDINFPTILMSHLLQAGGLRFLTIMWKISEISLRAYIEKKHQLTILKAPNVRNNNDINSITTTYFTDIIHRKNSAICEFSEKRKSILQSSDNYMKGVFDNLKEMQTEIFKTKENMKRIIQDAPVNPLIEDRLADIEDSEIIDLWNTNICCNIIFLRENDASLKNLRTISDSLLSLVSSLCTSPKILADNNLPEVNNQIAFSFINNNMQNHGLYKNNCLVLHDLFLILGQVLKQLHCYLKLYSLSDLSDCKSKTIECCEIIKSKEKVFQYCIEQICEMSSNMKSNLQKSSSNTLQTDFLGSMSQMILSVSPQFNFYTGNCMDTNDLLENLYFSPVKGKYKHLFERHKCNAFNLPEQSTPKFQLNESIESIASWKSPQRQLLIHKTHSPNRIQVSPRYSRLFSPNEFKKNCSRSNKNIAASTPKSIQASETFEISNIEIPAMQTMDVGTAMKNILDLSTQITKVVTDLYKSESSTSLML